MAGSVASGVVQCPGDPRLFGGIGLLLGLGPAEARAIFVGAGGLVHTCLGFPRPVQVDDLGQG
jgi:hypothetical protein